MGEISKFVPIRLLILEHRWRKETKTYEDLVSMFFLKKLMASAINFVNEKIMLKLSRQVLSTFRNITATLRPKCVS